MFHIFPVPILLFHHLNKSSSESPTIPDNNANLFTISSLSVYKPANLFIIVSKYFFPIPLLKISSVTISADVFLYQPEFPWLNSSNIYLLTLLNADTFSFASHLSPAILHSGLNSFPLFQFRFIIFQVHKKSLIAFITHLKHLNTNKLQKQIADLISRKESLNTQYVSFKQEIKELELIHQNLSKYLKQDAPEIQRSSHNQLPSL